MRTGMMDVHTRSGAVVRVEAKADSSALTIFSPAKERVIAVDLTDADLVDLEGVISWAVGMRGL